MHYPKIAELPPPPEKNGWPWTEESHPVGDTMMDRKFLPHISIVTPSYNQGKFIERTIRSVLLQDYPNLEYIIIDGGSNDNSVEIIQKYEPWLSYWVSESDRGQSHAINKGFERATGHIFHWLNSDDYLAYGALFSVAELILANPDAVAWVGSCQRIDSEGNRISTVVPRGLKTKQMANWSIDGFFYQPSCFFSSKAWQAVGFLNEELTMALDVDLWLRLSKRGDFISTPDLLSFAVIHSEAKTQKMRIQMHWETLQLQIGRGYFMAALRRFKQLLKDMLKMMLHISEG